MLARALALAALLVAPVLAGCVSSDSRADDAWQAARAAHGPAGLSATLDLSGGPVHLRGEAARATLAAPLALAAAPIFPSEGSYLYLVDADVAGAGRGLLVLEGTTRATAGRVTFVPASVEVAERVAFGLAPEPGLAPTGFAFPPAWEGANASLFFAEATAAYFGDVTLEGHARAALVTSAGATELEGPVRVANATGLRWSRDARLVTDAASVAYGRFTVSGNVTGGRLTPEGESAVAAPEGVFGRDARLDLSPMRVASAAPFRLTQALVGGELLLPAKVEARPDGNSVSVKQGETAWLAVRYRESTFRGDAVLDRVDIAGSGAEMVKVPLERPPLFIEAAWDEVATLPPYAGVMTAFALTLATPGILVIDVVNLFACAFLTCPEQHPFPAWMDAGDLGTFYVKVQGDLPPGAYDATVTLVGRNYESVRVPLAITVAS